MRNREKLAREWAEDYQKNYPELAPETQAAELVKRAKAAAEYIMEHTAPTMADVDWDHETMPGTGALTVNGRLWIMRDDAGDAIDCISTDLAEIAFVAKEGLTPNGKRYELREKPDHPEVLETVEDYENAPEGTIVVTPGEDSVAVQKLDDGKWGIIGFKKLVDAEDCSRASADHGATTVLRWGW
ncbi:hypothetical protein [Corynebacterium sp. p3-SID1194]|uniref:hypothetical protein n=1 Tax=Corynebacterium sp. p3-SID1194 TaxID=2916105 RepID=UPI0021A2B11A|nr:hypothetical protein [Corynebacterium sp. p3-SID1194]MCT1450625.1 hypothetical protein [Corynebacterium sp. p3-SID1194]